MKARPKQAISRTCAKSRAGPVILNVGRHDGNLMKEFRKAFRKRFLHEEEKT